MMKAASNNGLSPSSWPQGLLLPRFWLESGFGPPHCVLSMQFHLRCPGSKCDNVRMPHCANSKPLNCDHPLLLLLYLSCSPSKYPLWAPPFFAAFVSSNFGSPAFFNSMHVFKQVSIIHSCMFAKWISELFSICILVFPSCCHTTCEKLSSQILRSRKVISASNKGG